MTKAVKTASGKAVYELEGPCSFPGFFPPNYIKAKMAFEWLSTFGNAEESIELMIVPGFAGLKAKPGTIQTKVTVCDRDPFVSPGVYNCTGKKFFANSMKHYAISANRLPLLAGSVPASQVGTATQALKAAPPTPPEPGLVRIVSPTQNQAIPTTKGFFEVKFEDNPAVKPDPDGAVKLERQRFDSRSGWVPHPGPQRATHPEAPTYVEDYTKTKSVSIKDGFPNSGKYRVRALASPGKDWSWASPWREFSIYFAIPALPKAIKKIR